MANGPFQSVEFSCRIEQYDLCIVRRAFLHQLSDRVALTAASCPQYRTVSSKNSLRRKSNLTVLGIRQFCQVQYQWAFLFVLSLLILNDPLNKFWMSRIDQVTQSWIGRNPSADFATRQFQCSQKLYIPNWMNFLPFPQTWLDTQPVP